MQFILSSRTLRLLVLTLCGEDPDTLKHVDLKQVVIKIKFFILSLPFHYQFLFSFSLFLLEWGIPPFTWKILPFSWMSLHKRVAYLERWQGSPFYWKRMIFKLLSSPCLMHLYAEKSLLIEIGFSPSLEDRRSGHGRNL
jgi:hypothetical protein